MKKSLFMAVMIVLMVGVFAGATWANDKILSDFWVSTTPIIQVNKNGNHEAIYETTNFQIAKVRNKTVLRCPANQFGNLKTAKIIMMTCMNLDKKTADQIAYENEYYFVNLD